MDENMSEPYMTRNTIPVNTVNIQNLLNMKDQTDNELLSPLHN